MVSCFKSKKEAAKIYLCSLHLLMAAVFKRFSVALRKSVRIRSYSVRIQENAGPE